MEPARQAIAAANGALDAIGADAKKYVPDQYNQVLGKLNALNTAYGRQNYEEVIAGAPAVLTAVKGLAEATTAVQWSALSVSVPAVIGVLQGRADVLERSRMPPESVDLTGARRALAVADTMWKQAQSAASEGRTETAVLTARKAQERAHLAAGALKVALPPR